MRCPGCGADGPAGSKFCTACGAALPLACAACGQANPRGARFCAECGAKLAADDRALASAPPAAAPAERRQLTIMFCDLVGSTALSARLDPEELRDVIGAYHRACADTIARAGGFVAKYMGDGVLAYFGYPRAHEDDAERAVRAGLDIIEAVGKLHAAGARLQVRIGIATGLVVVGDLVGEGAAQEQSVVGETPNLAARLQALADPDAVVIAASTRRLLGGLFAYRALGLVPLKGLPDPVAAFEVIGPGAVESRFEARQEHGVLPLVGRDEELELLLRRWWQAQAGAGRVVLLTGEAGIGKSRLAAALAERIAGEPHVRLRYYCSPNHQDSALHPFITQIERAAGFAREDSPEIKLAKLEALLARSRATEEEIALIAGLLSLASGERDRLAGMSPQRRKEKTLQALLVQSERLAAEQPVLTMFEDANWMDPTSLELLNLSAERESLPILQLITARPEFVPSWPAHVQATAIALTRLDRHEGTALVERVAGGKVLPAEVLEQILARTDGVPLFVEELTKTVLESGLLRQQADRYVLTGSLPVLKIPSTLHDSLMARLDRLGSVREVAQIGAALGREFSYGLLAAVAELPEAELENALNQLVYSELVFHRSTAPDSIYTFKHALVQDAAYETMLKSRRQQLHLRVADVIEHSFPAMAESEPETLARHLTAAAQPQRAIPYWIGAGQRALQHSAIKEAISHLDAGLALLASVPDALARARFEIRLRAAMGFALTAMKGYAAPEVEAAFCRAIELCESSRDIAPPPSVLRGLAAFRWSAGDLQAAKRLTLQLVEIADRTADRELALVAHSILGGILYHIGDIWTSEHYLEKIAGEYEPAIRRNIVARFGEDTPSTLRTYHGYNLAWLGHLERAQAAVQDAVASARRTGHPLSVANALARAAVCPVLLHDPVGTAAFAEPGLAIARELGFPFYEGIAAVLLGWATAVSGKPEPGLAQIREGMGVYRATGAVCPLAFFFTLMAEVMLAAGDVAGAVAASEEACRWSETTSEHGWDCRVHCTQGDVLAASGAVAKAEVSYEKALVWSRERQAKWGELNAAVRLARLWRTAGASGKARDLLAPVYGWFPGGSDTAVFRQARELLGELAFTRT
jgi:class 3 adenylate cyclase/tetratricopeptide (TPR) repeat protein